MIYGLDSSLTNAALCWIDSDVPHTECFTSPPAHGLRERFARYTELAGDIRVKIRHVSMIARDLEPVVFLEGYSVGSKHAHVAIYEFGAVLRQSLLSNVQVIEVPPTVLKKFATGKGNAPKEQVMAHVARRWGQIFDTNDEADAYVLCRLGRCFSGVDECETAWQREAVEVLKNPKVKKKRKAGV